MLALLCQRTPLQTCHRLGMAAQLAQAHPGPAAAASSGLDGCEGGGDGAGGGVQQWGRLEAAELETRGPGWTCKALPANTFF
eukprot:927106-Pelagomonas_calceolata.AAC.1